MGSKVADELDAKRTDKKRREEIFYSKLRNRDERVTTVWRLIIGSVC